MGFFKRITESLLWDDLAILLAGLVLAAGGFVVAWLLLNGGLT